MHSNANQYEFGNLLPQQFCKNVLEKFVVITLLLKKSMILLKGQGVI